MIILGIETSCDETALSLIEVNEGKKSETEIKILANEVLSQIAIHKEYGGVFPNLAKREHNRNLIPLLKKILIESGFGNSKSQLPNSKQIPSTKYQALNTTLEREPELLKQFLEFIPTIENPRVDIIAVTAGPGLEPALWVGINFAKALSLTWDIPVVATNHMEGHILVSLLQRNKISNSQFLISNPEFPALALLISGGHTELVLMRDWLNYEIVGKTRDDAIGEAFDKVARILGLPYPGGPEISALAEEARKSQNQESRIKNQELKLPRPMIKSDNLDFSFSGLKTAVLYLVQKLTHTDPVSVCEGQRPVSIGLREQSLIAKEFEDSVTEVVVEKVKKAIEIYGIKTLILGGGVIANKNIRTAFEDLADKQGISLNLPAIDHATDNALMIAIAGYFNRNKTVTETTGLLEIKANGNLHF